MKDRVKVRILEWNYYWAVENEDGTIGEIIEFIDHINEVDTERDEG